MCFPNCTLEGRYLTCLVHGCLYSFIIYVPYEPKWKPTDTCLLKSSAWRSLERHHFLVGLHNSPSTCYVLLHWVLSVNEWGEMPCGMFFFFFQTKEQVSGASVSCPRSRGKLDVRPLYPGPSRGRVTGWESWPALPGWIDKGEWTGVQTHPLSGRSNSLDAKLPGSLVSGFSPAVTEGPSRTVVFLTCWKIWPEGLAAWLGLSKPWSPSPDSPQHYIRGSWGASHGLAFFVRFSSWCHFGQKLFCELQIPSHSSPWNNTSSAWPFSSVAVLERSLLCDNGTATSSCELSLFTCALSSPDIGNFSFCL